MILKESSAIPMEGFFWIIDDKVIGITSEVPQYNYNYELDDRTHKNTWKNFKKVYTVNGKEVPFDYYPRGRVMVDPNYDLDGKFEDYTCIVFLDKCINNSKYKQLISGYYNLDIASIPRVLWTVLSGKAHIDHYQCNNCRRV